MAMEPTEQSRFDKTEITIRPVANGWLLKEGPVWWAFTDHEALMKKLIEATSNQRKTYGMFLKQVKEVREAKEAKEKS